MIKLEQAIRQMNPGDKFSAENITMDKDGILRFPTGVYVSMCQSNLDLEGEIIRAEPEVLTAEYIINHRISNLRQVNFVDTSDGMARFEISRNQLLRLANDLIKNGQIKEWKRLKPLIDALGKLFGCTPISWDDSVRSVEKEFKNLTPPWETE